ncbi:MAG: hypothetical protein EXR76_03825 [Myxococcales bacterium]|nr:hypothetical protein [Myxococcales bacterium]
MAIGLALLALWVLQSEASLPIPELDALQKDETFRRLSGTSLLVFLGAQWVLPFSRLTGRFEAARRTLPLHRLVGLLAAPLIFLHTRHLGYGLLALLPSIFLTNALVGLCDQRVLPQRRLRERYARPWLGVHIVLACLTMGLALAHLYLVFAYQRAA